MREEDEEDEREGYKGGMNRKGEGEGSRAVSGFRVRQTCSSTCAGDAPRGGE